MPKAPHPVEAHDAAILAAADHFTAFQFRGRGERHKRDALPSMEAADKAARELLRECPTRPVAIYAIKGDKQAHVRNVLS